MIITNCPKCGSMNITTAGVCANCGWSQFAQVTTVSTRITSEIEIMLSVKVLLDDYKRLLLENRNLKERVAELEAERRWIPVSERMPETDGQYIGYTNTGLVGTHWLVDGHFVVTYSCEQNWLTTPTSWILESASGGDVYVTHWMPLPESPNDTQTQTIVYGKESD